jgi:hypothetical protein
MPMDSYRGQEYNPFAPAMSNSGGAMEAGIPQLPAAQAAAMAEQDPSVKEQAIGVAMDKGLNYGADKGVGMLSTAINGLGKKAATDVVSKHVAKNAIGTAAGKGGGMAAGMTGMAAAAAPVLPLVIGAMALKSIFKK